MLPSGVYQILNTITGQCYIGASKNVKARIENHKSHLRHDRHSNPKLQQAWNEFGEEAFLFSMIEPCLIPMLTVREQFWLDQCQNKYNKLLVAALSGGDKSDICKARISAALTGVPKSPEHAAKIIERNKGEKQREAIRSAHLGKPKSPEAIARMRQTILSNPAELERRRISSVKAREALAAKHAREGYKPMSDAQKAAISAGKKAAALKRKGGG